MGESHGGGHGRRRRRRRRHSSNYSNSESECSKLSKSATLSSSSSSDGGQRHRRRADKSSSGKNQLHNSSSSSASNGERCCRKKTKKLSFRMKTWPHDSSSSSVSDVERRRHKPTKNSRSSRRSRRVHLSHRHKHMSRRRRHKPTKNSRSSRRSRRVHHSHRHKHMSRTKRERQQLLHGIFWCHCDCPVQESLRTYAAKYRNRLTCIIPMPGDPNKTYMPCSMPETRKVLRRFFRILRKLHKKRLSLGGNFSESNIVIQTTGDQLNVYLQKCESKLIPYTEAAGLQDFRQFTNIIRTDFFHKMAIPNDIKTWLYIVETGLESVDFLATHYALLDPEDVRSLFLYMRRIYYGQRMIHNASLNWTWNYNPLAIADPNKVTIFESVKFDPCMKQYVGWKSKSNYANNTYTKKTYQHKQSTGSWKYMEDDVTGVIRFLRNCCVHDAQHEKYFVYVIDAVFPTFLTDFQRAMNRAGLLQQLDLADKL